jgi:hypothetical protein
VDDDDEGATVEDRVAWVDRIAADPPVVHPGSPDGAVWRTEASCYRFMAEHVRKGWRTLETGAGLSTVLFAAWECEHVSVVPFAEEAGAIESYCDSHSIPRHSLHFDLRPSEIALPSMLGSDPLDLVFIDGSHGFPMPIIDWFYGAGLLRRGGVAVFDDVQLPQVRSFVELYLEPDPRWLPLASTAKWVAFRRDSEGSLAEGEWEQDFFPKHEVSPAPGLSPRPEASARPAPTLLRRVKDVVPLSVKRWVREL